MRGFFIEDAECLQFDLDSVEVSQPKLQNILKCPVRENSDLIFQAHVRSRRSPSFQVKRLENTKRASDSHHCPVGFLASCNSPPLPGSSCPPCRCQCGTIPPPQGVLGHSAALTTAVHPLCRAGFSACPGGTRSSDERPP